MFIMPEWETENSIHRGKNMVNRWTEQLNKCRHKNKYALISYDSKDYSRFLVKVSTKCFTQNYCFQESGWLPLPVAHQITGHTDFPWKHFAKTLMWRHIMEKIPWYCKFNVLFIWLKIAAVSAWNFQFQISCFLRLKTFEVL